MFLSLLFFILSAVLLTVIQAPIDWSFLAWMALVPFALACTPTLRTKRLFLWASLAGFLYWMVNLYWIIPITIPGWIFLGLYLGLLWPALAVVLRWCRSKNMPLVLALPVLVVGIEYLQGFPLGGTSNSYPAGGWMSFQGLQRIMLGGFLWRLLGHSQYVHTPIVQIADIFGAGGVSFLVAMVNGFLVDVIAEIGAYRARRPITVLSNHPSPATHVRIHQVHLILWYVVRDAVGDLAASRRRLPPRLIAVEAACVVVAVAATLLYGQWRIEQTEQVVTPGPLVASLQSNVPQSVKGSLSKSDVMFNELLAQSREAAAAGADLIAWPETMVQKFLQPHLWPLLEDPNEDRRTYETLAAHARGRAYVLVGTVGADILSKPDGERYVGNYNSAFMFRPDGTRDPGRYDKIHLVLFGEYLPFRHTFPWLITQIQRLMPEAYRTDYSLEHGRNYTVFEMNVPIKPSANQAAGSHAVPADTKYRFGIIICYEDTVPYVARNFTLDENGNKRIDWLVNISNDGWFVRFLEKGPSIKPSAELPQHAAICTFRAIENRVPIVRSVNTGISCLIDSLGRIHDGYLAGSQGFPQQALRRTGVEGWFLDRLPTDKRVTFYSRHGPWLDTICALIFAALLATRCGAGVKGVWNARRARKK